MNIKKGDNVIITKGKDAGKTGKVISAIPKKNKVVLEHLNLFKRHERPRKSGQKGQVVEYAAPINVSNVSLLDPKTNKATRIGSKMVGGKKTRISKKSGQEI